MPMPEAYEATIGELELDPENPRLPERHQGDTQNALLETMARDYSLIELAQSFIDNGYFREEPLVTVRRDHMLKVVEGNRRLAALRFLSDQSLIEQLRLGPDWAELATQWRADPIDKIPVLIYKARDEIVPFLGFRHISGVKRWDPREKARFINSLLERKERSFADLARMLGSTVASVRSNYVAYRILRQARDDFDLDVSRLEESFGVFLRTLSSAPVKQHIGVELVGPSPGELLHPVPSARQDQLREIVEWIFGMGKRNPVIRDSREITKLGWVLSEPEALQVLRTTGKFELALALTQGEKASLVENLRKASYHLDEVKRDVDRHRDVPEIRDLVARLRQSMDSIVRLVDTEDSGS